MRDKSRVERNYCSVFYIPYRASQWGYVYCVCVCVCVFMGSIYVCQCIMCMLVFGLASKTWDCHAQKTHKRETAAFAEAGPKVMYHFRATCEEWTHYKKQCFLLFRAPPNVGRTYFLLVVVWFQYFKTATKCYSWLCEKGIETALTPSCHSSSVNLHTQIRDTIKIGTESSKTLLHGWPKTRHGTF